MWEGKWGGRGGREAGSRGEKLVYQRGLIMETHRKPLRRIFHDVAQEPWHKSQLTHTHAHTHYFAPSPPPCNLLIPHNGVTHPPTLVSCSVVSAEKVASHRLSKSVFFKVIGRSVSRFSLSATLAAPAPVGAQCQLPSLACHWLAALRSTGHAGQ